ncbi:transcriptional regulator, MerR family [Bacillus sp. JCM 19047]|nr:transcriptional regulator, MerR family [Bacillus sp. JCM 19047]
MVDLQTLVGKKIRLMRRAQNLTQHELAEKTGLIDSYIGGVERGERNISLRTLEKIVQGLEISISDLFVDINDKDEYKQALVSKFISGINNLNEEQIDSIDRIITEVLYTYNKA